MKRKAREDGEKEAVTHLPTKILATPFPAAILVIIYICNRAKLGGVKRIGI